VFAITTQPSNNLSGVRVEVVANIRKANWKSPDSGTSHQLFSASFQKSSGTVPGLSEVKAKDLRERYISVTGFAFPSAVFYCQVDIRRVGTRGIEKTRVAACRRLMPISPAVERLRT